MAWSRNGSTTRTVIIFATIITLSFFLLNIPGISKTQSNSIEALTLSKNIYQELMQQKDLLQHVSQFQASIHTNVSNGLNGLLGLEQFIPTLTDDMLKPRKQLPYNNRDSDPSNSSEKNDNLKSSQPYLSHHLHDTNPEYIIGVPTVFRKTTSTGSEYLLNTLSGLFNNINHKATKNVLVLVIIGETNNTLADQIFRDLNKKFPSQISEKRLLVFQPKTEYYPILVYPIRDQFEDPVDRQQWRTKQNLDYIYMWLNVLKLQPRYFLQLEDDLQISDNFYEKMVEKVNDQNTKKSVVWKMLEFNSMGFIGKLFGYQTLLELTITTILQFRDKPCDWILDQFLNNKYCSPDMSPVKCRTQLKNYRISYSGMNLFTHIGKFSSLPGQIRKIKPPTGKTAIKELEKEGIKHKKPPVKARVTTNLVSYKSTSEEDSRDKINKVYTESGIFWANTHKKTGRIYVLFEHICSTIDEISVKTGGQKYPTDKLHESTEVYALISSTRLVENKVQPLDIIKLGNFEKGVFELDDAGFEHENIAGIEIRLNQDVDFWVFIRDVYVRAS